jgi:hypothetical protein
VKCKHCGSAVEPVHHDYHDIERRVNEARP